jgi:predicted negative regulator of RcsB-dependent stress response
MENEIDYKLSLTEKIITVLKKKKKLLIFILSVLIIILIALSFFNFYQNNINKKIAEKYIKAGIYLSSKNDTKAKSTYTEIVASKNNFYSILALNNIIENDLENNSDEVLKLFKIVENINIDFEQKNLVKLKKALYLKKISKDEEGNMLLDEIIADNSIWKETAIEIPK